MKGSKSSYDGIENEVFGFLKPLYEVAPVYDANGSKRRRWLCECDCGTKVIIKGVHLKSGGTTSCGCSRWFNRCNFKHGDATKGRLTPEYLAWTNIKRRCYNPNNIGYKDYGGRGITVCKRWLNNYNNFLKDMGRKPSPEHSIDRKNNNGNYTPSNCRWATKLEQNCNKRPTSTYGGKPLKTSVLLARLRKK